MTNVTASSGHLHLLMSTLLCGTTERCFTTRGASYRRVLFLFAVFLQFHVSDVVSTVDEIYVCEDTYGSSI
jgi:hypothetical protein